MWAEMTALRTRTTRTYENDGVPPAYATVSTLSSLHYESEPGSGVYDATVDLAPQRVDNAQFDGWLITANRFHYALGRPGDKSADGWVGFGHRGHWFKFRLARAGYLHWPTRTFDDIGGPPIYDRANLSHDPQSLAIGPNADQVVAQNLTCWKSLWTTPGDGQLDVSWRTAGDNLKEEITLNQAARQWIRDNRPPSTPPTETWFGFVFQLDWSDVPRIVRDGVLQSPDDDFDGDAGVLELRDAQERLLALLPAGTAHVDEHDEATHHRRLRQRFWRDGDDHYLLIGVRVDRLLALPDGDLIFDPTVTPQVSAGPDDAKTWVGPGFSHTSFTICPGNDGVTQNNFMRFTLNVPAAATITASKLTFTASDNQSDDTVRTNIYYEDANDPADFSADDYDSMEARVRSAASVAWDFTTNWTTDNTYDTVSLNTVIQALVNEAYWASGEHCVIIQEDDNSDNGAYRQAYSFDGSAVKAPVLTVTYSTGAAAPLAMHHYRRLREQG